MNRSVLKVALWDVLPCIAAYYLLRALNVSEYAALLSATAVGILRTAYVGVRERRLDGYAAFMCLIFGLGLGLVLSFVDAATSARWDALYLAEPAFRRIYYVMTLTWAAAFLAESAIRIPLVYLLPVDVMAGLSTILLLGTLALIAVWSAWYGKRGEAALSAS